MADSIIHLKSAMSTKGSIMTDPTLALHLALFAASRRRTSCANARTARTERRHTIDPSRTVRTLLSGAWIR